MAAPSASSTASASAPPPDVVLAACKAEVQQLRDALHEVALRDPSSSGSSGVFAEVLEGKYLALIKKNKDLTVQLGTAQRQAAAAEKSLQVEQEKAKRLAAAVTAASLGHKAAGAKGVKSSPGVLESPEGAQGGDAGGGSGSAPAAASSAALARVYDQLHQKVLAMAEVQRENAALRALVQREVGLRDDAAEVDNLLQRRAAGAGGDAATGGWRGRAEEIILLKSKLKDARREAEALAVLQSEFNSGGGGGGGAGAAGDSVGASGSGGGDPLGLPAAVRAFLGGADDDTRSLATATTAVSAATAQARRARRDVDDDARDRLSAMQQQRLAQQRELAADLAEQQRLVQEERLRSSALQARVKTMKSERDTLRGYVEAILDKSATDDDLVEAYEAELQQAQEEARQWQRKAAGGAGAGGLGINPAAGAFTVAGMRNGTNDVIAAAARTAVYRKTAAAAAAASAVIPVPVSSGTETEAHSTAATSTPPPPPPTFSRALYEWVCQACSESPVDAGRDPAGTTAPPAAASARQLAAVLRRAFGHVAEVERQHMAAAAASSAGTASGGAEGVLLKENATLKKRIRALTDMMEKEAELQGVLWATGGKGGSDGGGRG